ncbi:MAG: aldehyde dehydrogenase family protein [Saprospiraceae bacterium]|nr:aldehyde dehydrogenase family protein [Saprospiraceae bacterium]
MSKTFQVISPVDNSIYLEREIAQDSQIEKTLDKSQKAFVSWKQTSIADRAQICHRAVEYFLNNVDDIAKELTWQMGRPIQYSPYEISKGLKERADYMIGIAEGTLKDVQIPEIEGFIRYVKREPLGTVFVLAPWNYPFLTSVNAIIPALMAGNTVILKHAKQTPLCAERYAAAFKHAGIPDGVFQYMHLAHNQVADIIEDNRIDYVAFTGSVSGGAAVQNAMKNRFINAGLELGGKDPAYVRADANLENAIENLVDGSFFNSGQSCCGIERIYVHENLFDKFVEGFVSITKNYTLGNPLEQKTTLGPMVKTAAALYTQNQIDEAITKGASALIDSSKFECHDPNTPYLAPQILVNVNHTMDIMKEETFGPVVGIMSVKDDDEGVSLMNDSQYGLTASIWTKDLDQAKYLGDRVETGTLFMNRCDYLDPALAWTGIKNSGRGCTLSSLGYEVLTRPKSFHLKTMM